MSDLYMKKKKGRPSKYTLELAQKFCDALQAQSKSVKRLCQENDDFPNPDTIFSWIGHNKEFSDLYAQARRCQIEVLIDEILDIADDTSQDDIFVDDESNYSAKKVFNSENFQRSRLKIDTRKWLACKLVPRLYGDSKKVEDAGQNAAEALKELGD